MMERKDQPISVRVPIEIYEWVQEQAAQNDRSINGQLVHLLRKIKAASEREQQPREAAAAGR